MERVAEEHYGMVYAIALAALKDREAAEELAQETFLRAMLYRETIREPAALPGWLANVAEVAPDPKPGTDQLVAEEEFPA